MKKLIITNILRWNSWVNPFFFFNETAKINGIKFSLNPLKLEDYKGDDTIFNDSILNSLNEIFQSLVYSKNIDLDDDERTLRKFEDLLRENHEYLVQSFNHLPFLSSPSQIIQLAEKYGYEVYFFKFNDYVVLYDYLRNNENSSYIKTTLEDYFKADFHSITTNFIECDNILKTLEDVKKVIRFEPSTPKLNVKDYFPKQQLDSKYYSFSELESLYEV